MNPRHSAEKLKPPHSRVRCSFRSIHGRQKGCISIVRFELYPWSQNNRNIPYRQERAAKTAAPLTSPRKGLTGQQQQSINGSISPLRGTDIPFILPTQVNRTQVNRTPYGVSFSQSAPAFLSITAATNIVLENFSPH